MQPHLKGKQKTFCFLPPLSWQLPSHRLFQSTRKETKQEIRQNKLKELKKKKPSCIQEQKCQQVTAKTVRPCLLFPGEGSREDVA